MLWATPENAPIPLYYTSSFSLALLTDLGFDNRFHFLMFCIPYSNQTFVFFSLIRLSHWERKKELCCCRIVCLLHPLNANDTHTHTLDQSEHKYEWFGISSFIFLFNLHISLSFSLFLFTTTTTTKHFDNHKTRFQTKILTRIQLSPLLMRAAI